MRYAGIDVGAKELVVVIRRNSKEGKHKIFANTVDGRKQLCNYLRNKKHKIRICLEATGVYHVDTAIALSNEPECFDLIVANPNVTKSFGMAVRSRQKTDKADASVLAEFAEKAEHELWTAPKRSWIALRTYSRRLCALTNQKVELKNQLHAYNSMLETPEAILSSVHSQIAYIEAESKKLMNEAIRLVKEDSKLSRYFEQILSVKGFGELSGLSTLVELILLPEELTNKQWVAFAGLDPRHTQSGTSVNRKARISKAGNRYLRRALYMPAMTATRHDVYVRGYYQHLIEDNRLTARQAQCAVMRKLLHALHGMFLTGEVFDSTRFYKTPAADKVIEKAA